MSFRLPSVSALAIALFALCAAPAPGANEGDIYRILRERGIPFDNTGIHNAAVSGILTAVDPRACVMPASAAGNPDEGETIAAAEQWPGGICYLKLKGLYRDSGLWVMESLRAWSETKNTGLVIDLRDAAGTSLAAVDEIAGLFLPTNTPLYGLKAGNGKIMETHLSKRPQSPPARVALILVTDKNTKDASELLAAVLSKESGIMIVGTSTFGDNAVRENIRLSSNEVLRIATKWAIPSNGVQYKSSGLIPDVIVPKNAPTNSVPLSSTKDVFGKPLSEKSKTDRELMARVAGDPALNRAVDILIALRVLGFNATATNTENSAGK